MEATYLCGSIASAFLGAATPGSLPLADRVAGDSLHAAAFTVTRPCQDQAQAAFTVTRPCAVETRSP